MNDDITWCVKRAEPLPRFISIMKIYSTFIWWTVFLSGFANGILLYFVISKLKSERKVDMNYSIFLIIFPLYINLPIMYKTKSLAIRIYSLFISFFGIIFFIYSFAQMNFVIINATFYRYDQISSFYELTENQFKLIGSEAAIFQIKLNNNYYGVSLFCIYYYDLLVLSNLCLCRCK